MPGGGAAAMRLATLSEVVTHFRSVLDPSSAAYGRVAGPTVYVIITCDKSRGWMTYEVRALCSVCECVFVYRMLCGD